jgi:hypothetical protein
VILSRQWGLCSVHGSSIIGVMTTTNSSPFASFNPSFLNEDEVEAVRIFSAEYDRYGDVASAVGVATDQFAAGVLSAEFVAWLAS